MCASVCTRARSEHYSCLWVYDSMSVEEAGAGKRGENVRVRFCMYLFYIYCYFNVPSKENFHFYALYIDE